ncbi:MAG: amidohydrolase family protein [Acidimicrobiia bacterium]|nr:amidohydrolase family protein [Acidimicrobiia bacterium]
MNLVLTGRVVTFDSERRDIERGAVYIADGKIEAVQSRSEPPPPGFDSVRPVHTHGVIYPGLIDLHNHLAYNYRSLWFPAREEPYATRYQWPKGRTYSDDISRPTNALGQFAAKALLKFVEVKAAVAGVTAIQGSPKFNRPYEGWLVRNIEDETFQTGRDVVYQSVRNLPAADLEDKAAKMAAGNAFLYHLAEGTDPHLREEFRACDTAGCTQSRFVAIHATALRAADFRKLGRAGASIVWSPFSNLWLYAATTDVVAARDAGVRICLGSDWAPSGSKNVLGELKVAALWNETQLGSAFTDLELCEMVTVNPGDAMGQAWGERIGRIKPGLEADLVVTADRFDDPYRNLIAATERHIRLVLVGGRPVFGNVSLLRSAGVEAPEPITVAGVRRAVNLLDPAVTDADMTWRQVLDRLAEARRSPARAFQRAMAMVPRGEQILQFEPDMPEGELIREIRGPEDLESVTIPPFDTLAHDAKFFRALTRAPILRGLLDDLADYYR